ncbi:hypothetical protein SPF06_00915 [Sinomonas sp. JGH33]|uniref:Uncharacterized protein n=1 Tax=Sinomonas terricola TaxID=3110330 RepID=A0ABU5T0U0_9MICC|nr:hypothetical protein [Sinomonas sp. JGH33]MEA5453271.1 hypothetical protein [Sinomonas sp. JGH33]
MQAATECKRCGKPIETVTMTGITVWTHVSDELPMAYTVNSGSRFCGLGDASMAWPEGKRRWTDRTVEDGEES